VVAQRSTLELPRRFVYKKLSAIHRRFLFCLDWYSEEHPYMDRFVHTNGIQLHYLDHAGGVPAIVLMPGLTANAHVFDGLVAAGLSPRFRVLALDLRGRGLSDKPETGYSIATHAADVIGLLDALGIDQVVLGGHSFGGFLSFYIAAHYPERVSKLLILDAARAVHPRTRELLQVTLSRLGNIVPSWEAYLAGVKAAPFYGGWWDPQIETYYRADVEMLEDGTVRSRSTREAITQAMDAVLGEDWISHIAAITQPALLFNAHGPYGGPDAPPLVPPEEARITAITLPDCRYVETPGNHITMLYGEGAQLIVDETTTFLQGNA
jgi:pimeloyl-ACP methyl ester carboxylesterase